MEVVQELQINLNLRRFSVSQALAWENAGLIPTTSILIQIFSEIISTIQMQQDGIRPTLYEFPIKSGLTHQERYA